MIYTRKKFKIIFSQVLNEWLDNKTAKVNITTSSKYRSLSELYIKPKLGMILFKKINEQDIYNFFQEENICKLSDSTKKTIYTIINSVIKYGTGKLYRKKIVKFEIKFKPPKIRIEYLTKKEQYILEEYLKNNLNLRNLCILFDLYTGLRIGELCALQWKDIDFINSTVSINKTVKRIKNINKEINKKTLLILDKPKSESSVRIVPVPTFLIDLLKKFENDNKDFFIFTNSIKPKDPRSLEKYFSNVLNKCNIKNIVFHSLRHTYATRSREAGIDIKILSELLGHSSYKVTLDIYVHTPFDFKKDSVKSLVNYLSTQKFIEL